MIVAYFYYLMTMDQQATLEEADHVDKLFTLET